MFYVGRPAGWQRPACRQHGLLAPKRAGIPRDPTLPGGPAKHPSPSNQHPGINHKPPNSQQADKHGV